MLMVSSPIPGKKQQKARRISVEPGNDLIKSRKEFRLMLQELVIKVPAPFLGRADDAESEHRYILNLVRPLVFPFLRDCVRIGELALRDNIVLAVLDHSGVMAELELRRAQIVPRNGSIVLGDVDAA